MCNSIPKTVLRNLVLNWLAVLKKKGERRTQMDSESASKGFTVTASVELQMTCPSLFALALSILIGTAADGGSL